ncbi:MAG: hypothetical protein DRP09_21885 [Candidatus Thorarchaeota archaeon]|nr:MAG: hypothetical protein DRP09_21885 [Candidatus Thorarchaeota archaeon]
MWQQILKSWEAETIGDGIGECHFPLNQEALPQGGSLSSTADCVRFYCGLYEIAKSHNLWLNSNPHKEQQDHVLILSLILSQIILS